jgi:Mrp family chromosome partitioning ATPase
MFGRSLGRTGRSLARSLGISSAQAASLEASVRESLLGLREPVTGASLRDCRMVQQVQLRQAGEELSLRIGLQLPTAAYPERTQLQEAVTSRARELVEGARVDCSFAPGMPSGFGKAGDLKARAMLTSNGLSNVGHIVAVSSCKGGVGKSTVAVNLAYALERMGGRVGLFDADVFGPSLPSLVSPSSTDVVRDADNGWLRPLEHAGVRLMSYGWVSPRDSKGQRGGAVMRGPMVSTVVQQLSQLTDWGALDYLVVDMPPGTGDIAITLGQKLALSGAVIVTTPQKLALVDVAKGVDMFEKLKVPSLALVTNMAYFEADGKRHFPFGNSGPRIQELVDRFHIPLTVEFPIHPAYSDSAELGVPLVLSQPESTESAGYFALADGLVRALMRREFSPSSKRFSQGAGKVEFVGGPDAFVGFDASSKTIVVRIFTEDGLREHRLPAVALRRASNAVGAGDPAQVPDDVVPLKLVPQGNYAVQIDWSDGHSAGIFPYSAIVELASGY